MQNFHFFGDLEGDVMEIIWKRGNGSVRDVLSELSKKRAAAYTTVMTVMSRLHDKGVLDRSLSKDGSYTYAPKEPKDRFLASASRALIERLIKECGPVAVAQFMDILSKSDAKQKDKWRRALQDITARGEGE